MEENKKQQQFLVLSVSELTISSSSSSTSLFAKTEPVFARFGLDSGSTELRFGPDTESSDVIVFNLPTCQLFKVGPAESLCISEASEANKEKTYSRGISIQFRNEEESRTFHCAFEQWKKEVVVQECPLINGAVSTSKSKFDDKIEASSAKMYFHYYGQLLHQQNMLQDFVRTGTCYSAVIENRADFLGRVVVDVGAGSGILSLFAAQVIKGKVEDVELPEKADILISEPMDGR